MSVLILGATSPIGRQLAYLYAQESGEAVYVAARDGAEAEAIARDVELRFQKRALGGAFEATDFDSHSALIQHVEAELGPISVVLVVSGAMGIQIEAETDFKAAREIIDVNFTGAASLCEAAARAMEGRRQGSIVGVSSVAGDRGRQSNYFYGSAKGAF
ncbi:MAG: SDR family NAD(P)-dependent oxidoreductase, partial [Myxococcota bacterium]|nr:SDR family NAD(P)-dependent oxidoreductase [Myxococcota bacterium]